jgi:hypothetical protein
VRPHRPALRNLAGGVIAGSIAFGISTIAVRAATGGSLAVRLLEGATLLLAAVAYLLYVLAHHSQAGEVITRLVLVTPSFSGRSSNSLRASPAQRS